MKITESFLRDLYAQLHREEITFSRMVELINIEAKKITDESGYCFMLEKMKKQADHNIENYQDPDAASWSDEEGVLLTNQEAIDIYNHHKK